MVVAAIHAGPPSVRRSACANSGTPSPNATNPAVIDARVGRSTAASWLMASCTAEYPSRDMLPAAQAATKTATPAMPHAARTFV